MIPLKRAPPQALQPVRPEPTAARAQVAYLTAPARPAVLAQEVAGPVAQPELAAAPEAVAAPEVVKRYHSYHTLRTIPWVMDPAKGLDVDTETDLMLADLLLSNGSAVRSAADRYETAT